MTESELSTIEVGNFATYDRASFELVASLIAEVRRLRGLVKRLEWGSCDGCGNRDICTECGAHKKGFDTSEKRGTGREWDEAASDWRDVCRHHPNCPVFTPEGEVR